MCYLDFVKATNEKVENFCEVEQLMYIAEHNCAYIVEIMVTLYLMPDLLRSWEGDSVLMTSTLLKAVKPIAGGLNTMPSMIIADWRHANLLTYTDRLRLNTLCN